MVAVRRVGTVGWVTEGQMRQLWRRNSDSEKKQRPSTGGHCWLPMRCGSQSEGSQPPSHTEITWEF